MAQAPLTYSLEGYAFPATASVRTFKVAGLAPSRNPITGGVIVPALPEGYVRRARAWASEIQCPRLGFRVSRRSLT